MSGEAFLDDIPADAANALRAVAVRRNWPTGATLFHEGDRADRVLVIQRGRVKAVTVAESGIETTLGLRGPGEIVGELSAVDGRPRSASVVAIEPVEALVLTAEQFRAFLRAHPDAALVLLGRVAGRLRGASARQAEFGSLESSVRVARQLAELAEAHGTSSDAGIRLGLLSQDELASLCGASREAIARALRQFRADGIIETGRRSITVVDLEALRSWEPHR